MGKKLVIAEKPAAGKSMAKILGCEEKKNGYMEGKDFIVTWAIGHLIRLKYPEEHQAQFKEWKLETLPFTFDIKDSLMVIPDVESQFAVIKQLINRNDVEEIINAGDAGREGYLIQEWIYRMSGNQKRKKVLWASSLTDEALTKAFQNLKDPEEFDSLLDEAEARAESDYLYGINYSRALTLTKAKNTVLRYGRCQTPLLNIIVERDHEIENFVSRPYYNIGAEFNFGGKIYKGVHVTEDGKNAKCFDEKEDADNITEIISGKTAIIKDYIQEEKKTPAPLLYDLTTLQKAMNTRYGYSAKETLEIAQSLYETHKVLSYPRTDSRYLTADIYNEIQDHLQSCYFGEFATFIDKAEIIASKVNKRYFNDLKVTDHHALIPTIHKNMEEIYINLNEKERNVFQSVILSLIAIFHPDYIYDSTIILTDVESYLFKSSGTVIKQNGWKDVLTLSESEKAVDDTPEQVLPILEKNDRGIVKSGKRIDLMTKKKPEYTTNSLLAIMEKNGIGTPATRAEIIESLQNPKNAYIELNGKNYTSTSLGRQYIQVVPERLKNIDLTKNFESDLKKIGDKKLKKSDFLTGIVKEIEENVQFFKQTRDEEKIVGSSTRKSMGTCPICKKGNMIEQAKSYSCDRYKEGCNFTIWKEIAGKKISESAALHLIQNGKTRVMKGFKGKSGRSFEAKLEVKDGKVSFVFMDKKK